MRRKFNILNQNWRYLIILDACRYDFFKRVYRKFFNKGRLTKIISPASNTNEWCQKTFTKKHSDIVYISSNPFINSKMGIGGFDARDKFYKVYDVWEYGWDRRLGTIHPKEVNKAVKKLIRKYTDKRFIIHYMQPHFPYLGMGGQKDWSDIIDRESGLFFSKIKLYLANLIKGNLGRKKYWQIRKLFGLPVNHPMAQIIEKRGIGGLLEEYKKNLEIVLEYVAKLLPSLSGKVVITSDHGELLGENDDFGHYPSKYLPKLVEVPWMEIDPSEE